MRRDRRWKERLEHHILGDLIAELLVATQLISGYPAPAEPPVVEFLTAETLQERACSGPCAVLGWYEHGSSIYLDESLYPLNDARAQAILVHELVHYLQEENGAFGLPQTCERWVAREGEAYTVQYRWLMEMHPTAIARMDRPSPASLYRCDVKSEAETPAGGPDR